MPKTSDLLAPMYNRVIVTGGGSGIGREVTLALTERGVDVWIMGRRADKLEETKEMCTHNSGKVFTTTCDIRNLASVKAAFAKANADGPVQALVNSAGEVYPCAAERLTPEMFQETVSSMLLGAFNVLHVWSRTLIKAKLEGAFIAYTSTVNSRESPGLGHSGAAKAGLESLVRTWALELGRYKLRLNTIGPGLFPLTGVSHEDFFNKDMFIDNIPLRRFGDAEEIVGPTLFLLSRAATYITGTTLMVDGGMRLRPWFGFTPDNLAEYGMPVE